jgi:hypothetical protein
LYPALASARKRSARSWIGNGAANANAADTRSSEIILMNERDG